MLLEQVDQLVAIVERLKVRKSTSLAMSQKWNPEVDAVVKEKWSTGHSATDITRVLNRRIGQDVYTRNAVIGRIHRMKINRDPNASMAARSAPRTSIPRIKRSTQSRLYAPPRRVIPTSQVIELLATTIIVPPEEQRGVLYLQKDQCRWPNGDPRSPEFHFCHHQKVPGKSYCEVHCVHASGQGSLSKDEAAK